MSKTTTRRPSPSERRLRVIDAFIDILLEGATPKADEVAARADVSMATLFRYFDTLDDMRHDAMHRVLDRFADLFSIPQVGVGTRDARIRGFVSARFELHKTLNPLQLWQRSSAVHDPGAADWVHNSRKVMASQVEHHFATDLNSLTPARREAVVVAIALVTSVESWQTYRVSHDASATRTRRAWTESIDRLLPPH